MSLDSSHEVNHSDRLIVHDDKPFNAEPSLGSLLEHEHTPEELMYCRNHCPVMPNPDDRLALSVDGEIKNPVSFSIKELKDKFPVKTITAVLQCAGNRRKTMSKSKDVEGILWGDSTVANVRWTGVPLADILKQSGVKDDIPGGGHVCFASHKTSCPEDNCQWYGASIPLQKALDPEGDVLLAFEMNGKELSIDHGYPVRVVIPGYCGARWVKWLDRITISKDESPNFYQQNDYKVLPPEVDSPDKANSYWPRTPPLQELWLNSAIASAVLSDEVPDKEQKTAKLKVKGYAVPAPRAPIVRVEVSADHGATWHDAHVTYREGRWSWVLWEAEIDVTIDNDTDSSANQAREGENEEADDKQRVVWSRAWDEAGEVQTRRGSCPWNFRGVAYNGFGESAW